jgi:hypothetical protein
VALASTVPFALAKAKLKRAPLGPQVARLSPPLFSVGKLKLLWPPTVLMVLKALHSTTAPLMFQAERKVPLPLVAVVCTL